jgi:signal transduction histidine kinase
VEDTGTGMSEEVLQKIFVPFFSTKDVGEGTGLGLAVVHGIVKAHGGFIKVESAPERGSRFEVQLPVAEAPLMDTI